MLFATIGCSFTQGERLFYHKWSEEMKDAYKFIQKGEIEPSILWQLTTWGDWEYMRNISFSGLLSKTLNCDYLTYTGSNNSNINYAIPTWVETSNKFDYRKLDFIVLELTDPQRDIDSRYGDEELTKEEFVNMVEGKLLEDTIQEVKEVNKLCLENGIDLLVWSWQNELAELLKDEKFFIKIQYEHKEYISFEDAKRELPVALHQALVDDGVTDGHPSKFFNQLLHNSIVSKLKSMGYNIN